MHITILKEKQECVFFMDKKEKIGNIEETEDVTKYGEFVSSYFAWLTLEQQKKKTNKMENMTDK